MPQWINCEKRKFWWRLPYWTIDVTVHRAIRRPYRERYWWRMFHPPIGRGWICSRPIGGVWGRGVRWEQRRVQVRFVSLRSASLNFRYDFTNADRLWWWLCEPVRIIIPCLWALRSPDPKNQETRMTPAGVPVYWLQELYWYPLWGRKSLEKGQRQCTRMGLVLGNQRFLDVGI